MRAELWSPCGSGEIEHTFGSRRLFQTGSKILRGTSGPNS